MKITILHDDITKQDVDAIVNPVKSREFIGGGKRRQWRTEQLPA